MFGGSSDKPIPPWQQKGNAQFDPRLDTMRNQALGGVSQKELDATRSRDKRKRSKGRVGGMWGGDDEEESTRKSSEQLTSTLNFRKNSAAGKPWSQDPRSAPSRPVRQDEPTERSDGAMEGRLIDSIVHTGGRGGNMQAQDISKFLMQAELLDQLTLCEMLDDKLDTGEWKLEQKALTIIEAVLSRGQPKSKANFKQYFTQNSDCYTGLQNSNKKAIRSKANKIAKACGLSATEPVKSTKKRAAVAPAQQSGGGIFDLTGMTTSLPSTNTSTSAPPVPAGPMDLLAFSAPAPQPPKPTTSSTDFLSGLMNPTPPQQTTQQSSPFGMTPTTTQARAPQQSMFMQSMNPAPAPTMPRPTPPQQSTFGFSTQQTQPTPQYQTRHPGNAFNLMGNQPMMMQQPQMQSQRQPQSTMFGSSMAGQMRPMVATSAPPANSDPFGSLMSGGQSPGVSPTTKRRLSATAPKTGVKKDPFASLLTF